LGVGNAMEINQHISQRPAGLIFNNTILVMVRGFGQWAMESYQHIQMRPGEDGTIPLIT